MSLVCLVLTYKDIFVTSLFCVDTHTGEVMQKKILARAKSASVQQRFTSRSEALLQDMTRASAKPLPSNSSKKTTEPAKEQISRPPAEASTANASVSEHSVPPGGKSSTQRPVAPPSAQRTNCAPQKSVI